MSTRQYLATSLLTLICLIFVETNAQVAVGDTAINFVLPDTTGNPVNLQDFSGDVVLLNFFGSWCIPCQIEAPQLEDSIWNVFKNRGFTLIGVDFQETLPPLLNFIHLYDLTFPIVRDTVGAVFIDYGLIVFPSNVLINQNGVVVWIEPGFDIPLMKRLIDSLLNVSSVPPNKSNKLPSQIELISTYPNPFNNQTNIKVALNKSAMTNLKIYDISGQTENILNQRN